MSVDTNHKCTTSAWYDAARATGVNPVPDDALAIASRGDEQCRDRGLQTELYVGSRQSRMGCYRGCSAFYQSAQWPPQITRFDGNSDPEVVLVARVSTEPGESPNFAFGAIALNRTQAGWLLPLLQRFVDTGAIEAIPNRDEQG